MPKLVVCGVNHHSAPVAVRERFAIPQACLDGALITLSNLPHVKEAVLLSTCNRIEIYAVVTDVQAACCELSTFFAAVQSVGGHQVLRPNFRLLYDDVPLHLMRLAAGLESQVLGEPQILGQIKEAHGP